MPMKPQRLAPFDARSVLLFAALSISGGAALHAQTSQATRQPTLGPTSSAPAAPAPLAMGLTTPAAAAIQAAFGKADANRDSQLSPAEAASLPAIGNRFQVLDSDQDGFLSRAEFDLGAQP